MSDEFDELAKKAGMEARQETLKKGLPVFFEKNGLQLKEEPNGTIYEIEYMNRYGDYKIVRKLTEKEIRELNL